MRGATRAESCATTHHRCTVFDDGRLTSSSGEVVRCNNAIFIMTSNLGSRSASGSDLTEEGAAVAAPAAAAAVAGVPAAVVRHFRPELLSRIDQVVRFNPMSQYVASRRRCASRGLMVWCTTWWQAHARASGRASPPGNRCSRLLLSTRGAFCGMAPLVARVQQPQHPSIPRLRMHQVELQWEPDVTSWVARTAGEGGARAVHHRLKQAVVAPLAARALPSYVAASEANGGSGSGSGSGSSSGSNEPGVQSLDLVPGTALVLSVAPVEPTAVTRRASRRRGKGRPVSARPGQMEALGTSCLRMRVVAPL